MCIYGYASPVTQTTAPASAVGAVRRGSTINGLTSRNLPEKQNGPTLALAKGQVGPLFPPDAKWSLYA
jgi:hypothetical protein